MKSNNAKNPQSKSPGMRARARLETFFNLIIFNNQIFQVTRNAGTSPLGNVVGTDGTRSGRPSSPGMRARARLETKNTLLFYRDNNFVTRNAGTSPLGRCTYGCASRKLSGGFPIVRTLACLGLLPYLKPIASVTDSREAPGKGVSGMLWRVQRTRSG